MALDSIDVYKRQVEDMLVSQPDTGEQALEITEALVRSGAIDVIVVDSVAALVPRAEIEGEMGDSLDVYKRQVFTQGIAPLFADHTVEVEPVRTAEMCIRDRQNSSPSWPPRAGGSGSRCPRPPCHPQRRP